jgi:hypothetical protein
MDIFVDPCKAVRADQNRGRAKSKCLFAARRPKCEYLKSLTFSLELLSCSEQGLATLFGLLSWVAMAPIPESSYFPSLDKCLDGEQLLM